MDLKEQYDRLLRYCYMKTKDRFAAEDIVQETFLKFWQSHTYEDTGKEMAYLYTIARNMCTDLFRKNTTVNLDDYSEQLSQEGAEPEAMLDGLEIEQALDALPEQMREILVMRYVSEISAADIGKVLGMSRFSVNRRIKEGLKILKTSLEGGECNG